MGSLILDIEQERAEYICAVLWALWHARNLKIFQVIAQEPIQILHGAWKLWTDYKEANQLPTTHGECSRQMRRTLPQAPFVKVNSDAAVGGSEGVGYGVVIRNHQGHALVAAAVQEQANFQALEQGLENVILESDCLPLIQAINHTRTEAFYFDQAVEDVRVLATNFASWNPPYTPRQNNSVARYLAQVAKKSSQAYVWFSEFPEHIVACLLADSLPV